MNDQDAQKPGFPFHPLEDFVLGEVLGRTLEALGTSKQEAEKAILSHLPPDRPEFLFTPNAKKQVLLQSMPIELRSFLEAGDWKKVVEVLQRTIKEEGRLDLALELIEWIFTGFDQEDLVRDLFSLVLNDKIELKKEFYPLLKEEYDKEMRGDLDRFREK
ncbi:hypothetical protein EHQ53_14500 [Leptospira langatensis]|uniref:Uncharacterized protein n=1 Tax=Leptospira langatensis TaxID=2484983 RepID=A0A5F1ZQ43_9LEPT|nr:hypothetical protein [Leptospira langatensis]TGK01946.1 hypothetical protein EHO57_09150 [Leptospira langatensis]TGL39302.1 hypothetical protein EHQ53_14500 [Leptospira langatensis]